MKKILLLLAILLCFNCNSQKTVTTYSIDGNKVVFLDSYYTDYLKTIKVDYDNRDIYYKKKIEDPINSFFSKSEYSELVKYLFRYPIMDTTGLRDKISFINNNRERIEELISITLKECNKYLKNDSLTIYIYPTVYKEDILKKMEGIMGETAGSKQILIGIDNSIDLSGNVFKFTLAHEFNHAYWTNTNYKNSFQLNLLRYLVFEGKADSYAHFLYPNKYAPWDTSLSETEKTDLWNRIKPQLNSEDYTLLPEIMFGSANYPQWGGYNLGYAIVQSALKNNPKLTPMEWTNLSAEEILKMSDYN